MSDTIDAKLILKVTNDDIVILSRKLINDQISVAQGAWYQMAYDLDGGGGGSEVAVDLDPDAEILPSYFPYIIIYNFGPDPVFIGARTGSYESKVPSGLFAYVSYSQTDAFYMHMEAGETAHVELLYGAVLSV